MKATPQHFLESLSHIATLGEEAMALFISKATPQIVKKDDYLLPEGKYCQHIWFVETGACRAFHNHNDKEINTASPTFTLLFS